MRKLLLALVGALATAGCSVPASGLWSGEPDRITLKGDIRNEIVSAVSTVAGRIVEMPKGLGEPVKKGDVIAVIDPAQQALVVEQLQAVVNMKRARLAELEAGNRPEQIEQAEAQVRAAKAQLDLLRSGSRREQVEQAKLQVSIAEETVRRHELTLSHLQRQYEDLLVLFEEGAVSRRELDELKYHLDSVENQHRAALYQLEAAKQQLALLQNGPTPQEIRAAEANLEAAQAQLNLLRAGVTPQAIEAARADLEQSVAQLNQAKLQLENRYIRSLADGLIISRNYELGDVVNVGSTIADVAVEQGVYVLVYVPRRYADRIRYNQEVAVVTSLGERTGRVSYIALRTEYTPKDELSGSEKDRQTFKVKVAIDDEGGRLKSGMTADVILPLR